MQIFKKIHIGFALLLMSLTLNAQVGVGTNNPNSALDVRSTSQIAPTNTDGVLIPTIDTFPLINPTSFQDGMLVYFKGNTLQSRGFYYWDATLDMWVLYGGVNRIHQLNDGISYFVNTTDAGTNVILGEFEEIMTYNSNVYTNDMGSFNTAVGYNSVFDTGLYSNVTAIGYNAATASNLFLSLDNSNVFGYHDINENPVISQLDNSFGHLVKSHYSSLAIGHAYGDTSYNITSYDSGTDNRHETNIGSYIGDGSDAWSDSGMLYEFKLTTLGFDYETLPAEPLNSSQLFYDSKNDILQCRAKDVLRGINHNAQFNLYNHDFLRIPISLGYRESYNYNPLERNLGNYITIQNISLGYLAHDQLAHTNHGRDDYYNNLAIGSYALYSSETVNSSIAIGENALRLNTSDDNIAIGKDAMNQHGFGDDNTVLGSDALSRNISGTDNVAIGKSAGYYVSGDENTFVGAFASNGTATHFKNGNIKIGSFSGYLDINADRLYIENSTGNTPLIGGDFIYKTVGINRNINNLFNTFEVGGNASKSIAGNWLANSDGRLKKNILNINGASALNKITALEGVSYFWNDTQTGNTRPENIQYGFIAQDLMKVFPEQVTKDKHGFYQTAYGTYDAFVVEAIKELQTKFDNNDNDLESLDTRLKRIERLLLKSN